MTQAAAGHSESDHVSGIERARSSADLAALLHELSNHLGIVVGNLDLLIECQDIDIETMKLAQDALAGALRAADIVCELSETGTDAQGAPNAAAL
jgi:hypothetical protein